VLNIESAADSIPTRRDLAAMRGDVASPQVNVAMEQAVKRGPSGLHLHARLDVASKAARAVRVPCLRVVASCILHQRSVCVQQQEVRISLA
jgi:hypothetical protein